MTKKYKSIKDALMDGYSMHGFSSGGRLRILILSKENVKKEFYGEGVDYLEAFRILSDDVIAGGRKYEKVYGPIEQHYLTGRYPDADDVVDNWLYQGQGFNVFVRDEKIVVKLTMTHIVRTPRPISNLSTKEKVTIRWKFKLFDSIYTTSPAKFPNGDDACKTSVEEKNEEDGWIKKIEFEGIASDLSVAMTNAFVKAHTDVEYEFVTEYQEVT